MENSKNAARLAGIKTTLGPELFEKVQLAKVLVVGAGGTGCETLKNLVMSGFANIEVIDLDTIDVSNLNRQFLFRPHHVSKSKSAVARESVLNFNPDVNIVAHHGNVKSDEFDVDFFKRFDIALNCLDNVSARRHVNRLCLATGVPLVECGSTGYLGQVYTIKKGEVECYDCRAKEAQKKFPICTIRSTPSKPVHCIVWAKELFKFLFGNMEESMLNEVEDDGSDKSVIAGTAGVRPTAFDAESLQEYGKVVFRAFFHDEINKKLAMRDQYKGATHKPEPLALEALGVDDVDASSKLGSGGTVTQQQAWSTAENAAVLVHLVVQFWSSPEKRAQVGFLEFDKDDNFALDFVTAASNLRAEIFRIPKQSPFSVKGIAGNIVHAIATTNAIVAGMEVLECLKVLRGDDVKRSCKYTSVNKAPTRKGYVVLPSPLDPPNPRCYVCSMQTLTLTIDTGACTLEKLVDDVLKNKLGFNEPEFTVGSDASKLFYYPDAVEDDKEDGGTFQFEKMAISKLPGGGVHDGTSFTVTDMSQGELKVVIQVAHVEDDSFDEEKNPNKYTLSGVIDAKKSSGTGTTGKKRSRDEAMPEPILRSDSVGSDGNGQATSVSKRAKVL